MRMSHLAPVVTAFLAFGASAHAAHAETMVYIAAAKAGEIDSYRMNETSGALTREASVNVHGDVGPMALSPKGDYLYAGIRSQPFRVLSFAIDPKSGALTERAAAALPESMAYISLDPAGKMLFSSSYGADRIATVPIGADGRIVAGIQQLLHVGHNAHSIVADHTGRYVYATNLGSDEIRQYLYDAQTGMLRPNEPSGVATHPGAGPRHIKISPDNKTLYVTTELSGEVIRYSIDPESGRLMQEQSISVIPPNAGLENGLSPVPGKAGPDDGKPKIWLADIAITPDGKHIYTSERTTSQLTLLDVAANGTLSVVRHYDTEKQPRGIGLDPSGKFLIATGEKSDKLAVYAINAADGTLREVGQYPVGAGALWVTTLTLKN